MIKEGEGKPGGKVATDGGAADQPIGPPGANELLRRLHGAKNLGDVRGRDTVFLMDADAMIRSAMKRALARILPD